MGVIGENLVGRNWLFISFMYYLDGLVIQRGTCLYDVHMLITLMKVHSVDKSFQYTRILFFFVLVFGGKRFKCFDH